jgi:hypothetical protein
LIDGATPFDTFAQSPPRSARKQGKPAINYEKDDDDDVDMQKIQVKALPKPSPDQIL